MIRFTRRTFTLLDRSSRIRLLVFAGASVVISILEAMAVALIVPLTNLLFSDPNRLTSTARQVGRFVDVSSNLGAAAVVGVMVVVLFTIKGIAAILLLRWAIGNVLRQEARVARRLFSMYLGAPTAFHLQRNSAEIQRTLNESLPLIFRRTLPFVMSTAADVFTLVAVVCVIIVTDFEVAVVATVYFLVIGLVYQRLIAGKQRIAARRAHKEVADRYRQVQEAVRATKEITILQRHSYFIDRFYRTKMELVGAQRVLLFYQLMPRYFLDLAFVLGAGLMTFYAFTVKGPSEGITAIGLFLTAGFRLLAPLNKMMSTFTVARAAGPSVEQVRHDIAELTRLARPRETGAGQRLQPSALDLRDVSFRYEGTADNVLRGLTMHVEAGDDIGIVGATGAGKTTLLNILLGLLDPTDGDIEVDGTPLAACRTGWQLTLGYVPQEIMLLDDTLRTNIAFGVPPAEIDEARLAHAVRAAQLEEMVAALPEGLATMVGEAGVRLSGGQRQRVGLARALYSQPDVLVLDEATSALDSDTESRIMATIAQLRRQITLITVSHRLSTLKHCDRIYYLQDGHIAALGTFDQLNEEHPEFAQLVSLAQLGADAHPINGRNQEVAAPVPARVFETELEPFDP